MNKTAICCAWLMACLCLFGEEASKSCILFVNVNGAVSPQALKAAAAEIGGYLTANTAVADVKSIDVGRLVSEKDYCPANFGKAAACVFIVDGTNALRYLSAPLRWSIVNASNIKGGNPDDGRLHERVKRLAFRGVALACGCGATVDPACAMWYRGLCSDDPDKAGMGFSPGVFFPLQEILPAIGGDGIFTRQPTDE